MALAFIAGCGGTVPAPSPTTSGGSVTPSTTAPLAAPATDTTAVTALPPSTPAPAAASATAAPPPATTAQPPPIRVTAPGVYSDGELVVHIAFRSEVTDVTDADLASFATATLNGPDGWKGSGFSFVADAASELTVVLAEGPRVDELCLPLETFGRVSCQNGAVVALNADRWRHAFDGWDGTVAEYRVYLVNHEVGHLIGLRHPQERCPRPDRVAAAMEPQTRNLEGCVGNGVPLAWEIAWAANRPAVIGPAPDWDGPRPQWPDD